MQPLYVLLGIAHSGRRELLARLMAECREDPAAPLLLWSAASEPPAAAADDAIAAIPGLLQGTWSVADERIEAELLAPATPPAAAFLLGDGLADPRDLLEALPAFMSSRDLRLARILCLIDAAAVHATPKLQAWYTVAVHFSDVILIRRHPAVPNKLISALDRRLEHDYHPGLRFILNPGDLPAVDEILYPEARRISSWFDSLAYSPDGSAPPVGSWAMDGSPELLADEDDDPDAEPLFERDLAGHRLHPVPDLRQILPEIQNP